MTTVKATVQGKKVEAMKAVFAARKSGTVNTEASERVEAYNEVLSAMNEAEIKNVKVDKSNSEAGSGRSELTDSEAVQVIARVKKQLVGAIGEYEKHQGNQDVIDAYKVRVSALSELLPTELTFDEIRALVERIISQGNDTIPSVMRELKTVQGVNMGVASKITRELLG